MPNPPATIEAVLTAATAPEAEKSPEKMVVGVIEEKDAENQKEEEDKMVERMVKKVEDVLAISRRQGNNARAQRSRGQGNRSSNQFSNYKCNNCGTMGHLRRQCNKPQTPLTGGRGRGGPNPGYSTRRGRYRQQYGPTRATPFPSDRGV